MDVTDTVIRKAEKSDFFQVFQLLRESTLNSRGLPIDVRRRMFFPIWTEQENYYGFVLESAGQIVGFLGTLFTLRDINSEQHKICEIHSWYVKDQFRNESLKLLMPILGMKKQTIVNLTPTQPVYDLSKKLGFLNLESKLVQVFPIPTLRLLKRECQVITDKNLIYKYLSDKERKIFDDHLNLPCEHFVVVSLTSNDYSYFIMKKLQRRWFEPFGRIIYISNKDIFFQYLYYLRTYLSLRYSMQSIILSECDTVNQKIDFCRTIDRKIPSQFKSRKLKAEDISQLYGVPLMLGYKLH